MQQPMRIHENKGHNKKTENVHSFVRLVKRELISLSGDHFRVLRSITVT